MAVAPLASDRHGRDTRAACGRLHDDDLVPPGRSSTERGEIVRRSGQDQLPTTDFDRLATELLLGTR